MARIPEPFKFIMKPCGLLVLWRYLVRDYDSSSLLYQPGHLLHHGSRVRNMVQGQSGDDIVEGLIWKWLSATFCKQEGRVIVDRLPFSMLSRPAKHFSRDIGPNDKTLRLVSEFDRSEEHTSELQSLAYLVCRLLLEKKKK